MPHRTALLLLGFIVLGVVAGIIAGWYAGPRMEAVAWLGTLFLNALKMTIIPLILAAVITGVASLGDVRKLGRVGVIAVGYYACTTAIAVLIGLLVVNLIQPGQGIALGNPDALIEEAAVQEHAGIDAILLSLIPPNLISAAAEGQLLSLIVFAILFSATLTTLGEKGQPVLAFFEGVNEAMMKLVVWIMYFAPVGIFALIAARLGQSGGGDAFLSEISAVGWHVVTVLSGLALHFGALLLALFFIAGRGWSYLLTLLRALLTAFGTASSSATLPLTMECVRENKVDPRAVRFILPLGATINMDGTALYEAAAAMFIAQAYGIDLSLGQQVLIFMTATLAAIGAAGIPEAGLVTLVIVLNAVGLPVEGIGLLLAVDWFLDRFRTLVNVWGDAVGAAILARFLPQAKP